VSSAGDVTSLSVPVGEGLSVSMGSVEGDGVSLVSETLLVLLVGACIVLLVAIDGATFFPCDVTIVMRRELEQVHAKVPSGKMTPGLRISSCLTMTVACAGSG